MSPVLWLILCVTVSLAVTGFMVFAGIGDVPEHRSSHSKVTPTGGGLGVIAAIGIGALVLSQTGLLSPQMAQILSLIWAMGFLGFMDDIYNLAAGFKFFCMAIITAVAVWVIGPAIELPYGREVYEIPLLFGYLGSFFWIFVVLNIVNFMDGSNGLMVVVMGIATAALAGLSYGLGAPQSALLLTMLFGGLLGLIPYNVRQKARIFSGDVGALTIGFTYAVAALWLCQEAKAASPVYIAPVLILPFLVDGLFTIIRRFMKKENLAQAHRSHLYQRMIGQGYGHIRVAFIYGVVTAILAALAILAVTQNIHNFINFLLVPLFALSSVYLLTSRRFR